MRKGWIGGNWKMHKTLKDGVETVEKLSESVALLRGSDIVIFPPFTLLYSIKELIDLPHIHLGAQNMHWEEFGAYTGEISPKMLKDAGVSYVIIGHSERRKYFGESDETVNKKIISAIKHGLNPVLCVGETLEERKKMIQAALEETPIRYEIVAIPDIHNYPKWVDHVCSLTPSFDIVLSNNPLTRKLFREKGYKVEGTPLYNREVYSGEEIRRRISLDEPWEELVPSRVVRIIYSIGGVERIKKLYREGGEKTSFSKRINDTS